MSDILKTKDSSNAEIGKMEATDRTIDVLFVNCWGADIENVIIKFSASKSGVESNTYNLGTVLRESTVGPFRRHYQTGVGSELYDYWYVEFNTRGGNADHWWNKNNFSCVIDSSIDNSEYAYMWVRGADRNLYIGLPDEFTPPPNCSSGSNYTCYCSLDSD